MNNFPVYKSEKYSHTKKEERTAFAETLSRGKLRGGNEAFVILSCPEQI
jgi:hypothetical protein